MESDPLPKTLTNQTQALNKKYLRTLYKFSPAAETKQLSFEADELLEIIERYSLIFEFDRKFGSEIIALLIEIDLIWTRVVIDVVRKLRYPFTIGKLFKKQNI